MIKRRGKYCIVISEDAMVREDLGYLKTLPHFGRIWEQTAKVDIMRSVYPTITYPCHASMVTGVYPDRHGIVNNEKATVGELSSEWEHFRSNIRVPTVFDMAKKEQLTTASVFWPVSGRDTSVDWLINECWPDGEGAVKCFENSGSSPEMIKEIIEPNLDLWVDRSDWRWHPAVDNFANACACAIIRKHQPNLLTLHIANIDAYRHQTGLFGERINQGLYEADTWFGDIVRATEDAGTYDETNFFIVSDHGQMNVYRVVSPNAILAENGLIQTDDDGRFISCDAWCQAASLSSLVYLRDPSDKNLVERVAAVLNQMCESELYGISRVYTAEEAQSEERLAGGFSFVLETDGYTSFCNDWLKPLVRRLDNSDYRFGRATHGYQPDKGPQPTLFAFGPDITPGAYIEKGSITDIAPTIAYALGLEVPPGLDGKVLSDLFNK